MFEAILLPMIKFFTFFGVAIGLVYGLSSLGDWLDARECDPGEDDDDAK